MFSKGITFFKFSCCYQPCILLNCILSCICMKMNWFYPSGNFKFVLIKVGVVFESRNNPVHHSIYIRVVAKPTSHNNSDSTVKFHLILDIKSIGVGRVRYLPLNRHTTFPLPFCFGNCKFHLRINFK